MGRDVVKIKQLVVKDVIDYLSVNYYVMIEVL